MPGMDDIFKTLNRKIGRRISKGERRVARQFAHALAEMRVKISKVYDKYEVDGKLTWEEMSKYNRLEKLMKEIDHVLKSNYTDLSKQIYDVLGGLYKDGYERTAWAVETESLSKLNYATASIDQIRAAMINPVTKLSPRVWAKFERGALIQQIQQTVTKGLVEGSTYSTMSKSLKNDLNVAAYKTMRVVRTEGHRVSEGAKFEAVEHADKHGVKMSKTWNTLEDGAVRKGQANHRKLNNKTISTDELFDDGLSEGPAPGYLPAAASSINCRCFLTYSVEEVNKPQYDGLAGMKFDEWKEKRLEKKEEPPKKVEKAKEKTKPKKNKMVNMPSATERSIKRFDELDNKVNIEQTQKNRRKYAKELLKVAGLGHMELTERKSLSPMGQVKYQFSRMSNKISTIKFELQKSDRPNESLYKTMYHEFYHANYDGLETDRHKMNNKEWVMMEETMTETAGQYMNERAGNGQSFVSYSEHLAQTLPVLKELDEFEGANTIQDFGEIAMKYRFDDDHKTAKWQWLVKKWAEKKSEMKFDLDEYIKENYIDFIQDNIDGLTEYALTALESGDSWHDNKERLKSYIEKEINRYIEGKDKTNFSIRAAIMYAFINKGVK